MKCCALCNEDVNSVELEFGDAVKLENGEIWHVECYTEYFGEAPTVGLAEAV